jgi:DNA-binding NarL/FixJ family response regulator
METRLADSENRRQQDAEWLAQAESLNLNRRGQVLRLHRRGEAPSSIASALRLSPGEVKLIIKVFELGRENSDASDEI